MCSPARSPTCEVLLAATTDADVRLKKKPASKPRQLAFLDHPLADYFMLLGVVLTLLIFGLTMVFSASSVESIAAFGSAYGQFLRQAIIAAVGLPIMFWLSRRPARFFFRIAPLALVLAIILLFLVLVPGIGHNVGGQQNWIALPGGMTLQPSEFGKLALILWSARTLAAKPALHDWKSVTLPFLPVALFVVFLVLLERDVGTALVFIPIIAVLLLMVGVPWQFFALGGGLVVAAVAVLSVTASYRMQRFQIWLNPELDPMGAGWQPIHGRMALATGGWWGVGLGASREKWGALPEAHNDFIFAIIGEELGLMGTVMVLGLFGLLGLIILRIARRANDNFISFACYGIFAWVMCQAIINIGAVIGLLPLTGVPLPMISYGGSSLLFMLATMGVLLAFARSEPQAAAMIRARRAEKRRDAKPGRRRRRRTKVTAEEAV